MRESVENKWMTWLLMWCNNSIAIIIATLQHWKYYGYVWSDLGLGYVWSDVDDLVADVELGCVWSDLWLDPTWKYYGFK